MARKVYLGAPYISGNIFPTSWSTTSDTENTGTNELGSWTITSSSTSSLLTETQYPYYILDGDSSTYWAGTGSSSNNVIITMPISIVPLEISLTACGVITGFISYEVEIELLGYNVSTSSWDSLSTHTFEDEETISISISNSQAYSKFKCDCSGNGSPNIYNFAITKGYYPGGQNDGISHQIKKIYIGKDSVAKRIKKVYIGENGVARLCTDYSGRFICTGNSGRKYYSDNGTTWNNCSMGSIDNHHIAYGNGTVVTVGSGEDAYYSKTGTSWTHIEIGSATKCGIAFGNGKFVTMDFDGKIYHSTDGINWSYKGTNADIINITGFGNGKYIGYDSGTINAYYSTDGITWTLSTIGSTSSYSIEDVQYLNDKFIAIVSGSINKACIYYSTDFITWTQASFTVSITGAANIECLAYGNGKYIAIGGDGYGTTSTDGINWANGSHLISQDDDYNIHAIAYGNGKFCCVGASTYYSTDCVSWSKMSGLDGDVTYYGIVYADLLR